MLFKLNNDVYGTISQFLDLPSYIALNSVGKSHNFISHQLESNKLGNKSEFLNYDPKNNLDVLIYEVCTIRVINSREVEKIVALLQRGLPLSRAIVSQIPLHINKSNHSPVWDVLALQLKLWAVYLFNFNTPHIYTHALEGGASLNARNYLSHTYLAQVALISTENLQSLIDDYSERIIDQTTILTKGIEEANLAIDKKLKEDGEYLNYNDPCEIIAGLTQRVKALNEENVNKLQLLLKFGVNFTYRKIFNTEMSNCLVILKDQSNLNIKLFNATTFEGIIDALGEGAQINAVIKNSYLISHTLNDYYFNFNILHYIIVNTALNDEIKLSIIKGLIKLPHLNLNYKSYLLSNAFQLSLEFFPSAAPLLIDYVDDINYCNLDGESTWHIFLKNPQLNNFILLQKYKIDLNVIDYGGNSPLHTYLKNYKFDSDIGLSVFEFLLVKSSIYRINNKGESVLDLAIENAPLELITKILELLDSSIFHHAKILRRALRTACSYNNIIVIQALIDKGVDVNECYPGEDPTLSYCATIEVINFLLEKGANCNFLECDIKLNLFLLNIIYKPGFFLKNLFINIPDYYQILIFDSIVKNADYNSNLFSDDDIENKSMTCSFLNKHLNFFKLDSTIVQSDQIHKVFVLLNNKTIYDYDGLYPKFLQYQIAILTKNYNVLKLTTVENGKLLLDFAKSRNDKTAIKHLIKHHPSLKFYDPSKSKDELNKEANYNIFCYKLIYGILRFSISIIGASLHLPTDKSIEVGLSKDLDLPILFGCEFVLISVFDKYGETVLNKKLKNESLLEEKYMAFLPLIIDLSYIGYLVVSNKNINIIDCAVICSRIILSSIDIKQTLDFVNSKAE